MTLRTVLAWIMDTNIFIVGGIVIATLVVIFFAKLLWEVYW